MILPIKDDNFVLFDDEDEYTFRHFNGLYYRIAGDIKRYPAVYFRDNHKKHNIYDCQIFTPISGNMFDLRSANWVPRPAYVDASEHRKSIMYPFGDTSGIEYNRRHRGARLEWVPYVLHDGVFIPLGRYVSYSEAVCVLFLLTRPDDPYLAAYREFLKSRPDLDFPQVPQLSNWTYKPKKEALK